MADVTLTLKANNTDYIKKVKEAQKETQKLYDNNEKAIKREKGLVEDLEDSISSYREAWRKATSKEDIEKLNRKIAEAKLHLKEYEEAGVNANKNIKESGDSLLASIGKWVVGIVSITKVINELGQAFKDTVTGLNMMTKAGEMWKQTLYNIVRPMGQWHVSLKAQLKTAREIGSQLNQLRQEERKSIVEVAKAETEYFKLYYEASDRTKTAVERLGFLNDAEVKHTELIDKQVNVINKRLEIVKQQLDLRPDSEEAIQAEIDLNVELEETEKRRYSEMRSFQGMRSTLLDEIKEQNKETKDYINTVKELTELGTKYIAPMVEETRDIFAMPEKSLLPDLFVIPQYVIDAMDDETKRQKAAKKALDDWAIKEEQLKWDTVINAAQTSIAIIDALQYRHYEDEVNRLNKSTEYELKKAGDDEKKKLSITTLAEIEKEKIEKEYAKKRKAIAIVQSIIDTARAVLGAYLSMIHIPVVGPALATKAATYAAIFGAMQTAIIIAQKFAKGGWTGKGGMTDETGERIAGIVHEDEFVTRKGPAKKYREVLEAINKDDQRLALNRFTKFMPETIIAPVNNVSVENTGPNTRLDRINNQLYNLNRIMQPKRQTTTETMMTGMATVIRRGTSVRTIKR